jgi:hypothetical protein
MPERNSSSVDVDLLVVEFKLADAVYIHGGEGFINL